MRKTAVLKLQKEIKLQQVSLPGVDAGNELFFSGSYPDVTGRNHWLVMRYAPVRRWEGTAADVVEPDRRQFI